jgi:hypothetical protein
MTTQVTTTGITFPDSTTQTTASASALVANNTLFVAGNTINTSYTVGTGYNALAIGPITITNGNSLTVNSGSRLVVL